MSVPIVHIDYDEPDPSTYRGARMTMLYGFGTVGFALDSGNPAQDYSAVSKIAQAIAWATGGVGLVMCSSDVDNFIMDGGDLGIWE